MRPKVLISTSPFAHHDPLPVNLLLDAGLSFEFNNLGRKFSESELCDAIADFDLLIAGTESITAQVLQRAQKLKLVARVGIGYDNVDLAAARDRGVAVTNTPDAPTAAVADLALGHMLTMLRFSHVANLRMRRHEWKRLFGRRLPEVTVGLIGLGRIGSRVLDLVTALGCTSILVNDIDNNIELPVGAPAQWVSKEEMLRLADVISLHVPLTDQTRGLISENELRAMKSDAILVNTSRGEVVDEDALFQALQKGHVQGAAIDVFSEEPYSGPLRELDNCLLTPHMGSMSLDCRARMELEATEEVLRFVNGEPLRNMITLSEMGM